MEKLEAHNLLAADLYQDLLPGNEGTGVGNIVTAGTVVEDLVPGTASSKPQSFVFLGD